MQITKAYGLMAPALAAPTSASLTLSGIVSSFSIALGAFGLAYLLSQDHVSPLSLSLHLGGSVDSMQKFLMAVKFSSSCPRYRVIRGHQQKTAIIKESLPGHEQLVQG